MNSGVRAATWKVIASDTPLGTIAATTPGARTAARTRHRDRRLVVVHATRRHSQHTVAHRRPALHRCALLRSEQTRSSRTSNHSGNLFPARSMPAPGHLRSSIETFGPRIVFQSAASQEQGDDLAPCFGLQFFGHVAIDGKTEVLTVTLKDVADRVLWSTRIEPRTDQSARHLSRPLPG